MRNFLRRNRTTISRCPKGTQSQTVTNGRCLQGLINHIAERRRRRRSRQRSRGPFQGRSPDEDAELPATRTGVLTLDDRPCRNLLQTTQPSPPTEATISLLPRRGLRFFRREEVGSCPCPCFFHTPSPYVLCCIEELPSSTFSSRETYVGCAITCP
jgi:hypothetical protein